jgi:hypothetical protein
MPERLICAVAHVSTVEGARPGLRQTHQELGLP